MDDKPIYNIQTFLGIFKLILAKLIKKKARLEELEISDFRFSYSEYWNTPEKDENHSFIGYSASLQLLAVQLLLFQQLGVQLLGVHLLGVQLLGVQLLGFQLLRVQAELSSCLESSCLEFSYLESSS